MVAQSHFQEKPSLRGLVLLEMSRSVSLPLCVCSSCLLLLLMIGRSHVWASCRSLVVLGMCQPGDNAHDIAIQAVMQYRHGLFAHSRKYGRSHSIDKQHTQDSTDTLVLVKQWFLLCLRSFISRQANKARHALVW